MAISHVCNSCGVDLVRVRAVLDPGLNLPVVVCPGCSCAVVRRPHPVQRVWRRALRADAALSILFVQCLIGLGLLGAIGGMAHELAEVAQGDGLSAAAFLGSAFEDRDSVQRVGNHIIRHDDGRDAAVVAFALLSGLAGIWLTATYGGAPFWKRWAGWIGLLVVTVSLGWIGWAYSNVVALALGMPGAAARIDVELWWIRIGLLACAVGVMLAVSPVGLPFRWLLRLVRASLWKRQLRRARFSTGRSEH